MIQGEVLLVDDDPLIRQSTEQWLTMSGFKVTCYANAQATLNHLQSGFNGILVTDVMMPDVDGLTLMRQAQALIPDLPVILVTGHGDVDMAVKAVRDGAYEFIEKPFLPERLTEAVNRACEKRQLMLENVRLQQNLASQSGLDTRLIGISPSIQKLRTDILKCAKLDTNVIIYGETGTGKELVAQCLHEFSARYQKPFVALNCGAIPESLIESELFGHESGAFTGATNKRIGKFEYADGGTLLLDEIESMPHSLQVKLLRTLQEGMVERLGSNQLIPVNLRVIAASKADLSIAEHFRPDLFYRLNVSTLYLPPLRERSEDIPLLFEHYARLAATQHNHALRRINHQDIHAIQQYRWPGNVRELKNIAVRYALDGEQSVGQLLFPQHAELTHERFVNTSQPLATQVANFERAVLQNALSTHQGNIKEVMDMLNLPRRTLNQKMAKYGLNRSDFLHEAVTITDDT